jgi:transcriptional regulator with XRE-family HTH domain
MQPTRIYPGDQIAARRERAGLSRLELAYLSGLAETTIWRIETGRTAPNRGTRKLIALAIASVDRDDP